MTCHEEPEPEPESPDPALIAALRQARERRPWTVEAVEQYASNPASTKAAAAVCSDCEQPCEESEVCATVIVHEVGLLHDVGRSQAFHLVESGMHRLGWSGEGDVRVIDDQRPNTFIELGREP